MVALDVFDPRDMAPAWVNRLHVTTREHVIRREILVRIGDIYDQGKVDESRGFCAIGPSSRS